MRPIRTEQDYASALARIEALMDWERSPAEDDEFDALATLVEAYEDWHFPVDDPDPIEAIEFRIGQIGEAMPRRSQKVAFLSQDRKLKKEKKERKERKDALAQRGLLSRSSRYLPKDSPK